MAERESILKALRAADAAASKGDPQAAADAKKLASMLKSSGDMSWTDVGSKAIQNIPSSAAQAGKDLVQPFMHPIDTAQAVGNLALGGIQKLIPDNIAIINQVIGEQDSEKHADAFGKFFAGRYGSIEGFKNTVATDPVGVLADLSMLFTGGGSALARVPGKVGSIAQKTAKLGSMIDPAVLAVKGAAKAPGMAARGVANIIGGAGTHTGGGSLIEAAKAGFQGGDRAKAFRAGIEGTSDIRQVVDDAKSAVSQLKMERGAAYRAKMTELGKNPTVLPFKNITDAVFDSFEVGTFKGQQLSPSTGALRKQITEHVSDWKKLDPSEFWTAEGLDALKKKINSIPVSFEDAASLKVKRDVMRSIKSTIEKADPTYKDIMKDYSKASSVLDDLTRELSLGDKAAASTSYRKLTAALRNNVQTNYGERAKMVDLLESKGATSVAPTVAGASLNSLTPRGLGTMLPGLTSYGAMSNPALLAALPFMSPRLMGEAAYGAGKMAGILPVKQAVNAARASGQALNAIPGMRAVASPAGRYGAFQTGRAANQQDDYLLKTGQ
tara:strand:- start:1007 stop:2665 length:1659 start_codon:yes stop_codon:yes gene_type:complete